MEGTADTWVLAGSMVGEFAIAAVIYLEIEAHRLDRFLESAFCSDHFKARADIYGRYCAISSHGENRRQAFLELIKSNPELAEKCNYEIALMSRIGNCLPWLPWLRRRAVRWFPHSVVFLWEILGPYVEQRRKDSVPRWGHDFVRFALECLKEIRSQGVPQLVIRGQKQGEVVTLDTKRLEEIAVELENADGR